MALPTWEQLDKNQEDPEKIEEAIDRKIDDHLDDPDAHVETGQSLQSHKAAEIIDHAIGSVVGDKYSNREFALHFPFESLDNFQKSASGVSADIAGVELDTGSTINTERYIYAPTLASFLWYYPDRDTTFQFFADFLVDTNQIAYIIAGGIGQPSEPPGIGFKVINEKLYAVETVFGEEATEEYTQEIFGVDIKDYHAYRVQVIASENKAYFYVDRVLKSTLILHENFDVGLCMFSIYLKNTAAQRKVLRVGGIYISINPI